MNKYLLILPLVGVLSACGVSSSSGVMSHSENKGGILGMSTVDDVTVDGAGAIEGVQNIVIGSFKVGFVESAKQTNQAKGTFMKSAFGGKARGNMTLEGVSEKTKQDITNMAYNDFINDMKSKGYNIVDRSTLTSVDSYSSMPTKTFPMLADNSGFLSSYGKTMFYQPTALGTTGVTFNGDLPENTSGGASMIPSLTGISGAMSAHGDIKIANYAEKNGVAVVSVTYLVDFAAVGGHSGISSASIKVGQNLAVTQGSLKFISGGSSTFKKGTANIALGQPIESGQEFGTVVDDTSGANVAIQEATNVGSLLLGQGTNRSRNYIIKADNSKYKSQSVDILKKANDALISKI